MKKYTISMMLIAIVLLGLLLTGCADNSFASMVDSELFEAVPIMSGENISFSEMEDVGDENYLIWANDTDLSEYQDYLKTLEDEGFKKYVDNGENGIEEYVYMAHYLKDKLLVSVTHFTKLNRTMINVCEDKPLSKHLIYDESYVADNKKDAQTTLTMPELYYAGNSFVFQLKNGHFIVNDGAYEDDLPYLLDYMESLVPKGEKPVVEAWIVSHTHIDHMGVFVAFTDHEDWAKRISVEGVYYTEPSKDAHEVRGNADRTSALTFYTNSMSQILKTQSGDAPEIYRLREGERYYFNDITMDVIYTQDMLSYDDWKTWNATSTILTYTIEGQKIMLTGDTDWECQMMILEIFDDEYFDLTVYQAPHHGGNVYDEFSRHLKVDTVLYPCYATERGIAGLLSRYQQNMFLQSLADEAMCWVEGGVRLSFPYKVGTYERLPMIDWIHSDELPERLQEQE